MIEYDSNQQQEIRTVFNRFEEADCQYVIPRDYDQLPASVPGSDIEVLVAPRQFETMKKVAESAGFTDDSESSYRRIARLAVRNPTSTLQTVISRPRYVASVVLKGDVDSETEQSLRGQFKAPTFSKMGITLHLHNHLAYKSPMFQSKVRVDPAVEEGMLTRRCRESEFFVPSPPDELVHLVCRGVFDYEGAFPDYYVDRCERLWEMVSGTEQYESVLQSLLSKVFFAADELVYDHIAAGEYLTLREDLLAFADY